MNFQQYKQQKDKTDFESSFTHLCEKILVNSPSFEDWWIKTGIPVMVESYKYDNVDQLLNEAGWWDGLKNRMGFGGQPAQDIGGQPASPPPLPQRPMGQPARPQQPQISPEQQQKIAKYQQRADQEIGVIKKKFSVAMRDFVKSVTDEAKQSGDHHSWQIARKFCDKIAQATQPIVQGFAMKASAGKADYKDQYAQERGAMQGNQQAGAQSALKDKYSQGKPLQDLMNKRLQQSTGMNMGPDGQVPQGVQDTQNKLKMNNMGMGNYDPFDPSNYQAPPAAANAQAPAPTPQAVPGAVKMPRRRGRKPVVNPATGTNGMSFESVQDDMFIESLMNQSKKTTNFSIMGF